MTARRGKRRRVQTREVEVHDDKCALRNGNTENISALAQIAAELST